MRTTRPGTNRIGLRKLGLALVAALLMAGLLLPLNAAAAPAASVRGEEHWVRVYTVRPSDTLGEIALYYDVTLGALMDANNIRNPNRIEVGQELVIPEKRSSVQRDTATCANYHLVRRADTLSQIAEAYNVEKYALARANGIYNLNEVFVGQKICIPSKGTGGPVQEQPLRPMYEEPQRPKQEEPKRPVYEEPQRPKQEEPKRPVYEEPQRPKQEEPQRPVYEEPQRPKQEEPKRPTRDEPQRPTGPYEDGGPDRPRQGSDQYWKGSYYSDKYFSEFVQERKDLEINFNWLTGGPFNDMPQDRFSVRWEKVEYFRAGDYRFHAVADDGVRVYVDDQLIIDGWKIQPATEYQGDIFLREGTHHLVVEYYEEAEDAQIKVDWEPIRRK